jgi:hypothetical protein
MKSLRMKIAAGSRPPDRIRITPSCESMRLSRNASSNSGTMVAVPVTIEDSRSRP